MKQLTKEDVMYRLRAIFLSDIMFSDLSPYDKKAVVFYFAEAAQNDNTFWSAIRAELNKEIEQYELQSTPLIEPENANEN